MYISIASRRKETRETVGNIDCPMATHRKILLINWPVGRCSPHHRLCLSIFSSSFSPSSCRSGGRQIGELTGEKSPHTRNTCDVIYLHGYIAPYKWPHSLALSLSSFSHLAVVFHFTPLNWQLDRRVRFTRKRKEQNITHTLTRMQLTLAIRWNMLLLKTHWVENRTTDTTGEE